MKVKDLFDVKHGVNLELIRCEITNTNDVDAVNFVARTSENNGVVEVVKKIEGITPHEAGLISCAAHGSAMSSFVQLKPFYSGRALYVLTPKNNMTLNEKLYYCMCLKANAYRYNYGRSAEKTLRELDLPNVVPNWVHETQIKPITTKKSASDALLLNVDNWGDYTLGELFKFHKGKRLTKEDMTEGNVNFIGAISENNGVRQYIDVEPMSQPNCITVNYNGSVGEAFYQHEPFWASDDVNVLYADGWELNKHIAMFIITTIKANRYKFSYGRKWTFEKMKESVVKLPRLSNGSPDWSYMENYIKTLPYSDRI